MYHSVKFDVMNNVSDTIIGTYNTYEDWFLVPTSRPVIELPAQKINYTEVPGASSKLDLTYVLTKYPVYDNRSGSLEFAVLNDHQGYTWIDILEMITRSIGGKISRAYLEDDPDYYYEGHWALKNWKSNNNGTWSEVTIEYNVDPYKYYKTPKTFTKLGSEGSKSITFTTNDLGAMPVVPLISVSNTDSTGITVSLSNSELGISNLTKRITSNGSHKFYDLVLSMMSDDNTCTLSLFGSGQATVSFRKGEL